MRDKFILPKELESRLRGEPRPMVFTNGVFDILHRGHVTYLAQAKSLGAFLIVALNTDSSVKRLGKGVDRPINKTEDRIAVIEALESVDAVTSFEEDTPLNLIMRIKPDILVKGGDWAENEIVGSTEVKQWGGSTVSIPFQFDTSTSNTIERIREG
ncbi:MAG: D-glycero-beta-D-manno-heptose 1-phosphate adenylyltransferase [Burkholderiales bacterium]|nr:D-glycero-beta-D-manno-heptose 1-phosphate adenylyltransferase [Burkholderiales bacterium]